MATFPLKIFLQKYLNPIVGTFIPLMILWSVTNLALPNLSNILYFTKNYFRMVSLIGFIFSINTLMK